MTCKGCNTNFCYDCGVKTPHPAGSTCVHAHAGVHGEGNNNLMNVYNRPVPNNNQGRNRPGRERMNDPPKIAECAVNLLVTILAVVGFYICGKYIYHCCIKFIL